MRARLPSTPLLCTHRYNTLDNARSLLMRYYFLFFFNDTATTEIYALSLHDALPISEDCRTPKPSKFRSRGSSRSVLECGIPLPLFYSRDLTSLYLARSRREHANDRS